MESPIIIIIVVYIMIQNWVPLGTVKQVSLSRPLVTVPFTSLRRAKQVAREVVLDSEYV